jgi:hypothetical protein
MMMSNPQLYAPRKRKSKAPLIIGIIGAVVLLCCGAGFVIFAASGNKLPTNTAGPEGDGGGGGAAAAAAVGLNQPARDGKFEFTVSGVQCGIASVGSSGLDKKAQGQYCKVKVAVRNIGNEARTFAASNVYAYNKAGQKYDADDAAALYLGEDARSFLEDINPGNAVNGLVLFDIPQGQTITKVELHDSPFSGGVTVSVA